MATKQIAESVSEFTGRIDALINDIGAFLDANAGIIADTDKGNLENNINREATRPRVMAGLANADDALCQIFKVLPEDDKLSIGPAGSLGWQRG